MKPYIPLAILVAVMIPMFGYFANAIAGIQAEVVESRIEISRISSNRFTSADGLKVWQEIARLQEQIAVTAARVDMHLGID